MRGNLSIAFSIALVALFAWSLFQAQGFRAQARFFPMIIAGVGLALALVQLGIEIRRRATSSTVSGAVTGPAVPDGSAAFAQSSPADGDVSITPEVERRRTAIMLAWIAGFTLAVWLLGFPIAVPIATLAYLKFGARESWPVSVGFAAGFGVTFWALFVHFVRVPFDEGMLLLFLPVF